MESDYYGMELEQRLEERTEAAEVARDLHNKKVDRIKELEKKNSVMDEAAHGLIADVMQYRDRIAALDDEVAEFRLTEANIKGRLQRAIKRADALEAENERLKKRDRIHEDIISELNIELDRFRRVLNAKKG